MRSGAASLQAARRVHLVGIGGSGMSSLATLLLAMDKTVSGSDVQASSVVERLRESGATVAIGHRAENVADAQIVVRSSAIPDENPEIQEAWRRALPTLKHAEAAGELMAAQPGVAVAGTHGKTTTTALVAWLLVNAGVEPLVLLGGESINLGGGAVAGPGPMVVEADEYDRRFLSLYPEVGIVTSVEPDHLDYFGDFATICHVFQEFVDHVPSHGRLIVCADDLVALSLRTSVQRDTYGFSPHATWRIQDYTPRPGGSMAFTLSVGGRSWPVHVPLIGAHNARNVTAAIAAADYFGVGLRSALASLDGFLGTRRRFESHGLARGIWVVDDYAHHPTAVRTTLEAARSARQSSEGAVWAIFQPHTTHRTAALFDDFARAFNAADHVLLLPIYKPHGREMTAEEVTAADLASAVRTQGHPDARFAKSFGDAADVVAREARPGDLVLTMGAGDVTRLASLLVERLA